MAAKSPLTLANALAFGVPAALLAGAYISEYGFGLYPCEMCWWQRYAHFAALVLAADCLLQPRRGELWVGLAALAVLVSGLIGGFHAGVEYGWWEGLHHLLLDRPQRRRDPLAAIMSRADGPLRCCAMDAVRAFRSPGSIS